MLTVKAARYVTLILIAYPNPMALFSGQRSSILLNDPRGSLRFLQHCRVVINPIEIRPG